MYLEENIYPRKLKYIAEDLAIDGVGVVEYYFRFDSGCMIVLRS